MGNIHFRNIDNTNEHVARAVKLKKGQEVFIETVDQCLEEANTREGWHPVAIYSDEDVIGFAMYGSFGPNKHTWIDRIIIDEKYQGRGFGRIAMSKLIDIVPKEYGVDVIYLSIVDGNTVAYNLYKSIGFRYMNTQDENGELMFKYTVPTPKWREANVEPFKLSFNEDLKIKSIDGYPNAGNDVFECKGLYKGKEMKFFLKCQRQVDSNISNEVKILKKLKDSNIKVPQLLDYNIEGENQYIATKAVDGDRLSVLFCECKNEEVAKNSVEYMYKFGESLGAIHSLNIGWDDVKLRKFHNSLSEDKLTEPILIEMDKWLKDNEPKNREKIFVHGDHHYANLLWEHKELAVVLDWELCGMGWKEFDIAWSIILRPSQRFMKSLEEEEAFLKGYSRYQKFYRQQVNWCKVLIYSHFYHIGKSSKDEEYVEFIINEAKRIMNENL